MGKEYTISIRVDEEQHKAIERNAARLNLSKSEYVRLRATEEMDQDWIPKGNIYPIIIEMANTLNDYEEKEPKVVKRMKHTVKKLKGIL